MFTWVSIGFCCLASQCFSSEEFIGLLLTSYTCSSSGYIAHVILGHNLFCGTSVQNQAVIGVRIYGQTFETGNTIRCFIVVWRLFPSII